MCRRQIHCAVVLLGLRLCLADIPHRGRACGRFHQLLHRHGMRARTPEGVSQPWRLWGLQHRDGRRGARAGMQRLRLAGQAQSVLAAAAGRPMLTRACGASLFNFAATASRPAPTLRAGEISQLRLCGARTEFESSGRALTYLKVVLPPTHEFHCSARTPLGDTQQADFVCGA